MTAPKVETKTDRETKAIAVPMPKYLMEMGDRLAIEPNELKETIFRTCMYKGATAEEFRTFLVVASNLQLNPLAGEIYAFRKKEGGVQVIVGKDGFNTLNNQNPAYDGRKFFYWYQVGNEVKRFNYAMEGYPLVQVECHVFRKDHREAEVAYAKMSEYYRNINTWQTYPTTMLEHKAFLKASKGAFGYAGAVDADEASRFCDMRSLPPVAEVDPMFQAQNGQTSYELPANGLPQPINKTGSGKMSNKNQRGFILGLGKKGGYDEEQVKGYLASVGTPYDSLTSDQASNVIELWNSGDYSEIQRWAEGELVGEPKIEA